MARYTRNTVILALVESTYGTDPDAHERRQRDAHAASRSSTRCREQRQARDVLLGYLGQKEQLVGTMFVAVQLRRRAG
jgi:hypothetical protein